MRRYGKHTATTRRTMYLRKNIARSRRRAKLVGLLYLLGVIALAAAACLPLLAHENAPIGITVFYNTFLPDNMDLKSAVGIIKFANSALYALMVLVILVNVCKALGKLGWLFKGMGNKQYGFNRNAYAMEDMGRAFSTSFAWLLCTYILIGVLCGGFISLISQMFLIVVAAGIVIHLLAGFFGAKVRYYDLENGEVIEQKRRFGRFACLVRNVFQLVAVALIVYFMNFEMLGEKITLLLGTDGINAFMNDAAFLPVVAQIVLVLCLFVLVKHATAMTEYSMQGIFASGMKNFRIFAFLGFLASLAAMLLCMIANPAIDDGNLLYVVIVCFVSFVIELVMRKYPRLPEDMYDKDLSLDEEEFSFETLTRMQQGQEQNFARPKHATYIY